METKNEVTQDELHERMMLIDDLIKFSAQSFLGSGTKGISAKIQYSETEERFKKYVSRMSFIVEDGILKTADREYLETANQFKDVPIRICSVYCHISREQASVLSISSPRIGRGYRYDIVKKDDHYEFNNQIVTIRV